MYTVDGYDRVEEMKDVPAMDSGAPMSTLVQSEHQSRVTYRCREEGKIAVVEFDGVQSTIFGSPNDEALHGHPLHSRGLTHYSAFEVLNSSWIRALERANRVHRLHDGARFAHLRHFVWTFHDSTFECVSSGYRCRIVDKSET